MVFTGIILVVIDQRKSIGQEKIYINNLQKNGTSVYNPKKDSDFKI